ncbi:MAG: hypothetical protein IJO31_08470 [Oscillospiraceae bacterium]|nr:hypothetical protein [Oscillospiraceae bacterium]
MAAIMIKAKPNTIVRIGDTAQYIGWVCALFSALIVGRALHNSFFYIFAGISLVTFFISSTKCCVLFLLFLLPLAPILKPDINSMSFFTILYFLVVAKFVVANQKVHGWLLVGLIFFCTYNLVFSGIGQLTTIATMMAGFLMLYYLRYEEIDAESAAMFFSAGICLASILALLRSSLPIINAFITDAMLAKVENERIVRFSGLQGNANYHTLDITMALAAIVVIICNSRKIKLSHIVFIACLSIFGLMSVSKSFLIAWVLLLIFWFFVSLKQGVGRVVKFLFIALISALVLCYFAYDSISAYMLRLSGSTSTSLADITTGRTDIWLSYIKEIFSNGKVLFVGNGLNTILTSVHKGTHNTVLECAFSLGIVGSVMFLVLLRTSMGIKSYKHRVWLPLVILLIRMLAIGILTYDSLWFYFAMIVILAKEYNQFKINKNPS